MEKSYSYCWPINDQWHSVRLVLRLLGGDSDPFEINYWYLKIKSKRVFVSHLRAVL